VWPGRWYARSWRCCTASISGPPAAHRPGAARGVEPTAPTGPLAGVPGPARDAAGLAPARGGPALDLPTTSTADLRSPRRCSWSVACPREPTVGATSASTASCCAWASGCRPARSGGCCAPTVLTRAATRPDDVTVVPAPAGRRDHRLRFLHRRHNRLAAAVGVVLHRTWQPTGHLLVSPTVRPVLEWPSRRGIYWPASASTQGHGSS
jgi:hypothetical protein